MAKAFWDYHFEGVSKCGNKILTTELSECVSIQRYYPYQTKTTKSDKNNKKIIFTRKKGAFFRVAKAKRPKRTNTFSNFYCNFAT